MKNSVFIIILISLYTAASIHAIHATNKYIYIYKKDGKIENYIIREEIDSIICNKEKTYTLYKGNNIIQSYKNDLIDSISFIAPKYILSEKAIELSDDFIKHVSNVDSNIIYINNSAKLKSYFETDKILYNPNTSSKFPYGFLGKVKRISQDNGQLKIETQEVTLDEAFDYLNISDSIPLSSSALRMSIEEGIDGVKMLTQSIDITSDLCTLQGKGSIGYICYPYISIVKNRKTYARFVYKFKLLLEGKVNINRKLDKSKRYSAPIIQKLMPPLLAGGIIWVPDVNFFSFIEMAGSINWNTGISLPVDLVVSLEYKDEKWQNPLIISNNIFKDIMTFNEIAFNANLSIGLGLEFDLQAFGTIGAKIATTVGVDESGEISFKIKDKNKYEYSDGILKTNIQTDVAFGSKSNIFKNAEITIPIISKEYTLYEQHLLPHVSDLEIIIDQNNKTATASSKIRNNLLFSSYIGYNLYNKHEKKISSYTHKEKYKWEKDFPNNLNCLITSLSQGETYQICPFVNINGVDINLEPKESFTIEDKETPKELVGTWVCTNSIEIYYNGKTILNEALGYTMILREDGSFSTIEEKGDWWSRENKLFMHFNKDESVFTANIIELSSSKLIIEYSAGDESYNKEEYTKNNN